eukprot:TRINITY_DN29951_c0_g1_i1.p1 TRINITY_DN29951_c0_g1~~TRINITY_DN29951_c0_g1_i1.p1  ORF type:complete len:757 (-),score=107.12 TRINITY_DN29951_c0_g1_i1:688-2958(-)
MDEQNLQASFAAIPSLGALLRLACWTESGQFYNQGTARQRQDACCGNNGLDGYGQGCWDNMFTPQLCCPVPDSMLAGTSPGTGQADAADAPSPDEEPWAADRSCDMEWQVTKGDTSAGATRLQARGTVTADDKTRSEGDPEGIARECKGERRFFWDGEAVRSRGGSDFKAADATSCAWEFCQSLSELRLSPSVREASGPTWLPHPRCRVAVVLDASDGHWEIVLLPRRSASTTASESRRPADDRPSLYMLVVDSVSRAAFRRHMPHTYEFVTGKAATSKDYSEPAGPSSPRMPKSHAVTWFSRYHTAQWGSTMAQMLPMLYGGLRGKCKERTVVPATKRGFRYNVSMAIQKCRVFENAGPSHLRRSAAYRLAFSTAHWASVGIFSSIKWDQSCPFLGEFVGGLDDSVDAKCLADERYYDYVMAWNSMTLEENGNAPLFLYSHFHGRHLGTKSIELMDVALRDHLIAVTERHPNLIIALMSDHGVISKFCDQRAPIFSLLMPESILARRPELRAALVANKDQVISPWDLMVTLRTLPELERGGLEGSIWPAKILAERPARILASPVQFHQAVTEVDLNGPFSPTSVFKVLPPHRRCAAAGIDLNHCGIALQRQQHLSFACTPPDRLSKETLSLVPQHVLDTPQIHHLQAQVCLIVEDLFMDAIMGAVNVFRQGGEHVCEELTYEQMELFEVVGAAFSVRFKVKQGSPGRVFDARFNVNPSSRGITDLGVRQVTRYKQYEKCTPAAVDPNFCVCNAHG